MHSYKPKFQKILTHLTVSDGEYSTNIKAKELGRLFSSPRNFPQISYTLIPTNLFLAYEATCHRPSFWVCKVSFCSALCGVTMAANWKNLPPLCTCKSSFRTVHVIVWSSINIRTEEVNWANPLQISTSVYEYFEVQHGAGFRPHSFKFFRNPTEVPLWLAVCSFAYRNELNMVLFICYTVFAVYMCVCV
jgi:hypothetical protein